MSAYTISQHKGCFNIYQANGSSKGSLVDGFAPARINTIYDTLASEDSGRDDTGKMHITWLKGGDDSLVRLEIEMPPSDSNTISKLLNAVQGKEYYIEYWDIRTTSTNKTKTVRVYTSTSQGNCYSGILNNNTGLWDGVSFNAIAIG